MRIVLEIIQEMVLVLLIAEVLAAVLALPVWGIASVVGQSIPHLDATYWGAFVAMSALLVGIVIVFWVADLSKGVNL